MVLQYVFIKNYRVLANQGFNFSNRFDIDYVNEGKLIIQDATFFIEGFYGKSVSGIKGIVGENGVGKSTILDYIKDVLCFPMMSHPDNLDCILVFYNSKQRKFFVVMHGYDLNKSHCKLPKRTAIKFMKLDSKTDKRSLSQSEERDINRQSILSFVEDASTNGIVYLSNTFDGRSERAYTPQIKPYIFNLSVNFLAKGDLVSPETTSIYKHEEILKSIKLVLHAADHYPPIKLPKYVRISLKHILVDNFLNFSFRLTEKEKIEEATKYVLSKALNSLWAKNTKANKELRIKFWLCANLLTQLERYYTDQNIINELEALVITTDIHDFQKNLINYLLSIGNKIEFSREKTSNAKHWKNFIEKYDKLINQTTVILKKYDISGKEYNSFEVPLTEESLIEVRELIALSDDRVIGTNLLTFTWRDMSTGETMLLRFFANLYVFAEYVKNNSDFKFKNLLFLFDEIEAFYHPQWQKSIIKSTLDFINYHFKDIENQIIFTSHSPLTISDIPKSDLIFLKKKEEKVIAQKSLNEHKQTFAANIHSLLSDSFFIEDGHIGNFANDKISEVIDLLIDRPLKEVVIKKEYIENIIGIIGEPVIKTKLLELLENRLRANLIDIKTDLENIKKKLRN